jgi:hypothetical protein
MLGLGTNNSLTNVTSYAVQKLPFNPTYSVLEDFSDGVANKFTPQTGTWTTTSGTTGNYTATPPANDVALTTRPLAVAPLSYVEYSATVNDSKAGTSAGLIFAYTSANDFLYAGIVAGTNQVVLGHRSNGKWYVDAVASTTITAGTNYTLLVALTDGVTNNVNVVLNGKSVLNFNYNYLVHDGSVGLYARNGSASFDNVLIRGDDLAYAGGGTPQVAAVAAPPSTDLATVTADQLAAVVAVARQLWTAALGPADPRLSILDQVTVLMSDLPDQLLGATTETTIVLDSDAAGWGWFVDPRPEENSEFTIRVADGVFEASSSSPAAGHMDLLTTVVHEMGNAMGFAEDAGDDVAGVTLKAGERRLPEPAESVGERQNSATLSHQDGQAQGGPLLSIPPSMVSMVPADLATITPRVIPVSPLSEPRLALMSNIVLSPMAVSPRGNGQSDDLGKSFVSLSASLSGSTAAGAAATQDEQANAEHHSSRITDGTKETKINWDNGIDAVDHLASGPSNGSQEWLDDFLNHLGQDQSQWNPNAGLRVRPMSVSVAGQT